MDNYIETLEKDFDVRTPYRTTPEHQAICSRRTHLRKKAKQREGVERERLIAEYKQEIAKLLKTPIKLRNDKTLKYFRYSDDFLNAVKAAKRIASR